MASLKVFSFGGGVQSTAALVLAARGELAVDAFLFANVGTDSENPATLRYINEFAVPFAAEHHIELIELARSSETLLGKLINPNNKTVPIPMRMGQNGAPGRRSCTQVYKRQVIASWLYRHGARSTHKAVVMLGISLDEWQRMHTDSGYSYLINEYPLIDRKLRRQDCMNIIARAGLPVPPKSSCWFCPYHTLPQWRELRDEQPNLFDMAVGIEELVNAKRARMKKDHIWFSSKGIPLLKAIGSGVQPSLFEETCKSGFCMT